MCPQIQIALRFVSVARAREPRLNHPTCMYQTLCTHCTRNRHTRNCITRFTIIDIVVSCRCRRIFALFCALNLYPGRDRLLSIHNICINKFISHACGFFLDPLQQNARLALYRIWQQYWCVGVCSHAIFSGSWVHLLLIPSRIALVTIGRPHIDVDTILFRACFGHSFFIFSLVILDFGWKAGGPAYTFVYQLVLSAFSTY